MDSDCLEGLTIGEDAPLSFLRTAAWDLLESESPSLAFEADGAYTSRELAMDVDFEEEIGKSSKLPDYLDVSPPWLAASAKHEKDERDFQEEREDESMAERCENNSISPSNEISPAGARKRRRTELDALLTDVQQSASESRPAKKRRTARNNDSLAATPYPPPRYMHAFGVPLPPILRKNTPEDFHIPDFLLAGMPTFTRTRANSTEEESEHFDDDSPSPVDLRDVAISPAVSPDVARRNGHLRMANRTRTHSRSAAFGVALPAMLFENRAVDFVLPPNFRVEVVPTVVVPVMPTVVVPVVPAPPRAPPTVNPTAPQTFAAVWKPYLPQFPVNHFPHGRMVQLPVGRTESAHIQTPQKNLRSNFLAGRCAIPDYLLPVSPLSPLIFTPIPAYRRPLTAFGVPLPPCLLQIDAPPEEFRVPSFLRLGAAASLPSSVSVQPSPSARVPTSVPVSVPGPEPDMPEDTDEDADLHLLDSLFRGTAAVLIPPALCPPVHMRTHAFGARLPEALLRFQETPTEFTVPPELLGDVCCA
ncbi:hypothetical protein B0H14DRAFT_2770065 [Mycena olivaceomarginata]|nr:hypothetical protein B0H14DRAFT_2770065 [Mycena olivaceomarginata]